MDKQQLDFSFDEEIICKCGTTYYGTLPEVCLFCEIEKQDKIIIRFKKDSGYRTSTQNCAMCFYSTVVENGSLSCLVLANENIEMAVEPIYVCNCWSDGNENVMDVDGDE